MLFFRTAALVLTLLGLAACQTWERPAQTKPGEFDLRKWDFDGDKLAKLQGQWHFVFNELLSRDELNQWPEVTYTEVPSTWEGKNWQGQPLPRFGAATYGLKVYLPPVPGRPQYLALRMDDAGVAYTLTVNGQQIGRNGQVGLDAQTTKPSYYPDVYDFVVTSDTLDIVFQVANFSYRKGGLWNPPLLGNRSTAYGLGERQVALEFILLGGIFVVGFYHLFLFAYRRKDRPALYFGLLCFSVCARLLATGERLLNDIVPGLPWEILVKVELGSMYLAMMALLQFAGTLFPQEFARLPRNVLVGLRIGFFLANLGLPVYHASFLVPWSHGLTALEFGFVFYGTWLAVRRGREGAGLLLGGLMAAFVFVLNDMLHHAEIINTGDSLAIGFVVGFLAQVIFLSRRYSQAINREEAALVQSQELNQNLEVKVTERTRELLATNGELDTAVEELRQTTDLLSAQKEQLARINQAKNKLFAAISHDMRSPLTSVLSLVDLMRMDVTRDTLLEAGEAMARYAGNSLRMMDNLLLWSRMQIDGIETQFAQFDLYDLLTQAVSDLQPAAANKGIELKLLAKAEILAWADTHQISVVVRNLLHNAIKFSPRGGQVRLGVQPLNPHFWEVAVEDDGVGLSAQNIERLFFIDTHFSKRGTLDEKGTGIGLLLCKEFVDANGGQIHVFSVEGKGSRFSFTVKTGH